MKPHEAVRSAVKELAAEAEFSLDHCVHLAFEKLGDDRKLYGETLIRTALRNKITDRLGQSLMKLTSVANGQRNLFESLPEIRLPLKLEDGEQNYALFGEMRWPQVKALWDERNARREKAQADPFNSICRSLEEIMENTELTVAEAAKKLREDE